MSQILLVEDNASLARGLCSNLEFEGHVVQVAGTATEGLQLARAATVDLIILDLMLPDGDGYRVLRELREAGQETPVLILSALGEEADKVRGFRFGADDYVTKPFGLLELLGRVSALLRRAKAGARGRTMNGDRIRIGDIEIRPSTHDVYRRGFPVALRPKEFELLMALLRRHGDIVTRLELLQEVWGYDAEVVSRTVDTHIAELRRKIEDDPANPRYLITVRKVGYRFRIE